MLRSDLINILAARFQKLAAVDAEIAVKEILNAIGTALIQGNRVEIRGFGSFEVNYRAPRMGRNPKSGVILPVTAKHRLHFKAGKEMRECVNQSAKK